MRGYTRMGTHGAGGSVIDTVSGTVMLAITSAGVLSTTLLKPELAAAVLMAAIMLFAKAGLVDAADRRCAEAKRMFRTHHARAQETEGWAYVGHSIARCAARHDVGNCQ